MAFVFVDNKGVYTKSQKLFRGKVCTPFFISNDLFTPECICWIQVSNANGLCSDDTQEETADGKRGDEEWNGWQINTAFVERLNLTLRQHVWALARRTSQLAKTQLGLERSLALVLGYYNFCLPHASLSSTRQPKTPAMAAGITTQAWSLRELLLFRVPPWPQVLLE